MNQALYLFCLAKGDLLSQISGTGLDGRTPLSLHRVEGLAAVCSPISLEGFCGPEAEANLQDPAWLGPRVCRHEEVVERVMSRSPVLPLPFGTIFSSLGALEARVRAHRGVLGAFLEKVAAQEEWAVKGFWDQAQAWRRLSVEKLQQEADRLAGLSAGKRYFQQKKLEAAARAELRQWLQQTCQAVAEALGRYAVDHRRRKLRGQQATGGKREMVANWAFLVPRERVKDFQAQLGQDIAANSPRGLVFEYSGPWPPYSFAPDLELVGE